MAKMTYTDFCLLPVDGNQHELFDGDLVVTRSPNVRHQRVVVRLCSQLLNYVEAHSLGLLLIAPLDTIFDSYTVLQPDILFVSRERVPVVVQERIEGAPDLTVEILSPNTVERDRRRKLAVYSLFGVREYWIVDPEAQRIELYVREGGALRLARTFSSGAVVESPLFPGLALPVASVF